MRAVPSGLSLAAWCGALALGAGFADPAHAQFGPQDRGYVGPAFLQIPGVNGDAKERDHKGQVRVAAHYWKTGIVLLSPEERTKARAQQAAAKRSDDERPDYMGRRRAYLSVPGAPREGDGTVVIALDKKSKGLRELMAMCRGQKSIPELTLAVASSRSNTRLELGPHPAAIPEYFEFKLTNVALADCPVVEGAVEQAFVFKFGDIEWLNWQRKERGAPVDLQPAVLQKAEASHGRTRAWVVTWIANTHDVSDDQCPKMNAKPTEDDYFAFMPPAVAEQERAELKSKGGVNYENGQMGFRGPSRLNVTMLPGIVPDPGWAEPQGNVARGLNLDDDDGTRAKHKNYVSADGKVTGIDNQLYTVQGCVAGWQGHKGFLMQFANNQYHDGEMAMLVEISGIDDDRNDDEVFVTIYYSLDKMAKNAAGNTILADYTFDLTAKPELAYYNVRLPAKLVDGVVTTGPIDEFRLNLGVYGMPPELILNKARLRFELLPNGNLKGVVGGYRDWRALASTFTASAAEFYHGFQQPAFYYALRRNADGMENPVTGEFDGISTAYDIEGVPAFVGKDAQVNIATADAGGGSAEAATKQR